MAYRSVRAYPSAPQNVPANAFHPVVLDVVDHDGEPLLAAGDDELTVAVGGVYRVGASLHTGKGVKAGGVVYAWLTRSDVESLDMAVLTYTQGQDNVLKLAWEGRLDADDHLKLVVLHALPDALPLSALKFATYLHAALVEEDVAEDEGEGDVTPDPIAGIRN